MTRRDVLLPTGGIAAAAVRGLPALIAVGTGSADGMRRIGGPFAAADDGEAAIRTRPDALARTPARGTGG